MSKRVHFAETMTVYSEDESTLFSPSDRSTLGSPSNESAFPSPSFSVSSLSSSPDLSTPPPDEEDREDTPTVIYPVTPFTTQLQLDLHSPEIPISPKSMHIHFMLAYSPDNYPAMSWDISYPPPSPCLPPEDEQIILLKEMLIEPATSPPLTLLTITHPNLKWNIQVEPKDPAPGAYVSVNDVCTTIFKELRIAIHPKDYDGLTSDEARFAVDAAYYARCGRIPDRQARSVEHHKGIKRVDMLLGRTKFLGLSGTRFGPESWELNTSLSTGVGVFQDPVPRSVISTQPNLRGPGSYGSPPSNGRIRKVS